MYVGAGHGKTGSTAARELVGMWASGGGPPGGPCLFVHSQASPLPCGVWGSLNLLFLKPSVAVIRHLLCTSIPCERPSFVLTARHQFVWSAVHLLLSISEEVRIKSGGETKRI